MAEQAAEGVEVSLVGGRFLALVARPFLFNFRGGHGYAADWMEFSRLDMAEFYRKRALRKILIPGTVVG